MDKPQLAEPLLWDVETASKQLSLSKRYLQTLVAENRVDFVRVGRRVLFDPASLRAWIETRTVKAAKK